MASAGAFSAACETPTHSSSKAPAGLDLSRGYSHGGWENLPGREVREYARLSQPSQMLSHALSLGSSLVYTDTSPRPPPCDGRGASIPKSSVLPRGRLPLMRAATITGVGAANRQFQASPYPAVKAWQALARSAPRLSGLRSQYPPP